MLYACDSNWWRVHNGAREFAGPLKVTQDRSAVAKWGLKQVYCRKGVYDFLFERFGEIGWGGNGGFHAINLAIQFGLRSIVLVGFDCSLVKGYHWHGRHQAGLNNPKQAGVDKWRQHLDAQKPVLDKMGVRLLIGSPGSALTAYPKLDFMGAVHAACEGLHVERASS